MTHQMSFDRRRFLQAAAVAGVTVALEEILPLPALAERVAQDPRVASTPIYDKGFASTRKISEGVYATIADPSKGLQALSNGGFIVGKNSAIVIEGHHQPAGAAYELEALRTVSQVPVSSAVDTHYHFDHSFGNAYYGAQGIPVWAHARAVPMMVERYANLQGKPSVIVEPFQKALAEAKSEVEKQHAQSDFNLAQWMANAVATTVISLPSVPLDSSKLPMAVDLGGLQVVLEERIGHSPTDIILRIPDQNFTFTGDLLFNGSYPVAFDAQMSKWLGVLKTFASYGKDALFVPGHGAICDQEAVATERAVIEDLGAFARKMYDAGVPAAEAQKRYQQPERFRSLFYFSWAFCIGGAIEHFYEDFKSKKG